MQKSRLDYASRPLPPERLSGPGRWLILIIVAFLVAAGAIAIYIVHIMQRI